ncbi:hypothetical protein AX15_006210 [Amanita polypyramis BW_CC]|nr:hypothetical protein AX15_006210 [Amanita polypyramis BW_CC]
MSGKTLSTSTLSLRFMQNAQRAKSMKEVELEKAEIHDDARWEVEQEVRDAWGLLSERDDSYAITFIPYYVIEDKSYFRQIITHEASYLPFLFSDSADASTELGPISSMPRGRRRFDNTVEEKPIKKQEESPPQKPQQKGKETGGRSRIHPNPIPIQSVSGKGKLLSGLDSLQPPKTSKESKSAREVIFDNSGVGTDLRTMSTKHKAENAKEERSMGFLKPSGVDAPPGSNKSKRLTILDGAREKKHKRIREGSEERDEGRKKSKKKKQAT